MGDILAQLLGPDSSLLERAIVFVVLPAIVIVYLMANAGARAISTAAPAGRENINTPAAAADKVTPARTSERMDINMTLSQFET